MPSSPPQNPDEPSGLLRTLVAAFWGVFFALFLSRWRAPNQESVTSDTKQDDTNETGCRRQDIPTSPIRVAVDSFPPSDTPPEEKDAKRRIKKRWKYFGAVIKVLTVGLLITVAILTRLQWLEMRRTVREMQIARQPWAVLEDNLILVEPPIFTWGRPPRVLEYPSISITGRFN